MLFSINAQDFIREFKAIIQIIPTHTTFPILSNVKIKVEKNKINIFATDLDTSVIYKMDSYTEESSVIVVPARTLFSIVEKIEGEIKFYKEENRIKIEYEKGYSYLPITPEEDYPSEPEIASLNTYSVNPDEINEVIDQLIFIVPEDPAKRRYSGMLWDYENKNLRFVATDSFSLGYKDIKIDLGEEPFKIVVPPKILKQLPLFSSKEMKIGVDESRVYFLGDRFTLVSNLIKIDFPDYKSVISIEKKNILIVDKESFLSSLRRVSVFSNDRFKSVHLDLGDDLYIESFSEIGECKEEIKGEYKGDKMRITLSSNYLINFLRKIKSQKAFLNFKDEDNPVGIEGEDKEIFYLSMPITTE
ncbi:MAG: DNA polymerase III subunit beta [candidate division WOR-3 bacterium]